MAVLRKIGALADMFLKDQINRGEAAYESQLAKQRQQEVHQFNLQQEMVKNLAPLLQQGKVNLEDLPISQEHPLYGQLAAYAQAGQAAAPSRKAEAFGGVSKEMAGAKDAGDLGDLGGRFEQARQANIAGHGAPIDLTDVQNIANSFNNRADVLGNEAATKQEQGVATEQQNYDINHPEETELWATADAQGKPTGMKVFDKESGQYRDRLPGETFKNPKVHYDQPVNTGNDRPYFTFQTVYDPQGRPTGAMRIEGRTGAISFVPNTQIGGQLRPPPGDLGVQTISNEASLDALDNLESLFKGGANLLVGPAEGRLRTLGQKIPGVPTNDTWANFEAASSAFKNAVIKAITGAQMSEPEANRIIQQIPLTTDKKEVWQAKATQTRKNLAFLEARTRSDRGATPTAGKPGSIIKSITEIP